jgi:hypothetical protein
LPNVTLDRARAAKATVVQQFSHLAEVVGVGITKVQDDYAVKVNLSRPVSAGSELPTEIGGVPVRVEVTGSLAPRV